MLRTRVIVGPTAAAVSSAVTALALSFVASIDVLVPLLEVRVGEPAPVTLRVPRSFIDAHDGPELDRGDEQRGLIIARGEVLEPGTDAQLARRYERSRRPPDPWRLLGLALVAFSLALIVATYLRTLSSGRGALLRTHVGVFILLVGTTALAQAYLLLTPFPAQAFPVGAVGLWTALYLDRRTGLAVATTMAFLVGLLVDFQPTVVTVLLVVGCSGVLAFRNRKHVGSAGLAGALASVSGLVAYWAASMVFEGRFDLGAELAEPSRSGLIASAAGGAVGGLIAVAFAGVAVGLLGAVSRNRLLDLADLHQPLLRKMAKEAPGSWEHSRAMANLAEGAAAAIGADALLTRVGAYYHDLGKTIQPTYFVENLDAGARSPHEDLEPEVSADAIMAHVVGGTQILRRGGIPEPVVEFAYTHHGTSIIEFFWHKCLEAGNPKQLSETTFRYPGMRPRTKETAILMLVDSIEAAARTIDEPSRDQFEQLVRRIVFVKMKQGQLDESGLTIEELRVVIDTLVDTLRSVYHSRVKYPWQRQRSGNGSSPELPIPGLATEADVAGARASEPGSDRRDEDPDR
jgi:hypothetical protein